MKWRVNEVGGKLACGYILNITAQQHNKRG